MLIRKLEVHEYELAKELYCDSFFKDKQDIKLELLGEIIGLFLDNELIGMVQLDFINHIFEDIKILYINGFCIKKEYRHQGYGDKLLKWCISYAKEYSFDMIQMTSNKNRVYAHMLYEKNDFEIVDTLVLKKDIL